jgi:hypothetical protein
VITEPATDPFVTRYHQVVVSGSTDDPCPFGKRA